MRRVSKLHQASASADYAQGYYSGAMAAATDPVDTPGTATFRIWEEDAAGDLTIDTGIDVTVINRHNFGWASGNYGQIMKRGRYWRPITADCD